MLARLTAPLLALAALAAPPLAPAHGDTGTLGYHSAATGIDPAVVADDPGSPHRILAWNVALEVDGDPVAVEGTLDYSPPDEGGFSLLLLVPPAVLVLIGGVFWWLHRREQGGDDAATRAPVGADVAPGDDGVR